MDDGSPCDFERVVYLASRILAHSGTIFPLCRRQEITEVCILQLRGEHGNLFLHQANVELDQ